MQKLGVWIAVTALSLFTYPAVARDLRLGIDAVASTPAQDLRSVAGSNGYGGSLLLEWALSGSHALRTRFDFTRYSAKTATTLVLTSSTSTKTTATYNLESSGVGIDYLYYPAARQDGWHFDIGLEALRHSTDVRGTITFGGVTISTASFSGPNTASTRLGVDLGAGYTFGQRWNLGTRFNSVRDSGRTLDSFNLSLGYRW